MAPVSLISVVPRGLLRVALTDLFALAIVVLWYRNADLNKPFSGYLTRT